MDTKPKTTKDLPAAPHFLRLKQVLQRFPVSAGTWWTGVKAGTFPAAVKLTKRTTAWHSTDIDELIERTRKGGAA